MSPDRIGLAAAALLLLLSGCLPYSCRREESRAVMPADSLSRQLAAEIAMDTLGQVWTRTSVGGRALVHPRTVRFGPGSSDTLYVSDADRGVVYVFDMSGRLLREIDTVEVPYLAGVRGDTVAVFDPAEPAVHLLVDGMRVATVPIRDDHRPRTSLVYAAFGDDVYYKRVDAEGESFLAEVGRRGGTISRHPLQGPHWRHAGLLRLWGDTLLSLSGFRPVIDLLTNAGRVDSLALTGFDSPMLARSRSFMLGDVDQAPLLTSSAAAEGDRLFVLNMRAGWLRVDVFDRTGRLVNRLTERDRTYRSDFFPQDLDVRSRPDGSYAVVVAYSQPEPAVTLYTWDQDTAGTAP